MKTRTIPDSEKWLLNEKHAAKLDKALEWAEKTKPFDNFDAFVDNLGLSEPRA